MNKDKEKQYLSFAINYIKACRNMRLIESEMEEIQYDLHTKGTWEKFMEDVDAAPDLRSDESGEAILDTYFQLYKYIEWLSGEFVSFRIDWSQDSELEKEDFDRAFDFAFELLEKQNKDCEIEAYLNVAEPHEESILKDYFRNCQLYSEDTTEVLELLRKMRPKILDDYDLYFIY